MANVGLFPAGYDTTYFTDEPWGDRVDKWLAEHRADTFVIGNVGVIRELLRHDDSGLRMVVNITADALRSFLREGAYRNLYQNPVIGGTPRGPSDERKEVDVRLGIGSNTYFGAVALGGSGIRFYGEYCMVLKLRRLTSDTRILDRDSFDLLNEPLSKLEQSSEQLACLCGTWGDDRVEMAVRRVLPELSHDVRLVTSGTISEAVLRDQEYIEIHLDGTFATDDIAEVRHSPDDASTEISISEREREGLTTTLVERMWRQRRADVASDLEANSVPQRVVTLHGRGYQWK
jgi:hypothetical protein